MRQSLPMQRSISFSAFFAAALLGLQCASAIAFAQPNDPSRATEPPRADIAPTEAAAGSELTPPPIEEVVITGEQPGPSLWKVTHGSSHVVWVLGTVGGIPKEVKWRSRQVEDVIAHAQAVIFGESVTPNIGLFRSLLLLRAVLKARFNPDKAVLESLITPEQYARWLVLRKKYFKDDDDIERVRPMFIAMQLNTLAIRSSGLNEESSVGRIVARAAKKHDIPVRTAQIRIDLPDPRQAIRDFAGTPRAKDLECFIKTLDNLDTDVQRMKSRAAAWAVGDIEAFRKLPAPVAMPVCIEALTSAPALQGEFTKVKSRVVETWLWDVEKALELNDVTLVVMSLDEVLSPTGRLARLRERGYTIEEPVENE